ncbi:type IV toxin-antitoxin system AbiEi family antitoxin domain-containing protein [Knoellia subterranea]|uniref:AbiEi antitoxin N-terminal domain-containing protein n=1 Tax=Knoellia subterranea KCTC 19937 TaxID=1385521 RepID=A0A0A0JNR4_9MICO|nr:type IV toxin-antitoxin system AbiEi family antitoxin domain-containing protein [Knoellia subterranea]KGN37266.1 hypothetical protein N803_15665 [Knoellia subterranea KCTC 19937]
MTTSLEPALIELAHGHRGFFTTEEARRVGTTPHALVEAVKGGLLHHPARGLYAVSALVDNTQPQSWHIDLSFAATLLWDDAALGSTSSVLSHGVTVWGPDLGRIHVLRPIDRTVQVGVFRVRRWRGQPVVDTDVGPAVELSHALAQHAVDHGLVAGVVSADNALHEGLVTIDELRDAAAVLAPFRNGSRATTMVAFADGARESVGESRTAVALMTAGLTLDPQVEIRDRSGHLVGRVDFLVRGTNVIVEFDGRLKYDSGDPSVLWAEKKREDALRRLGYVVVRLTWADLESGAAVAKVRSAIAAA